MSLGELYREIIMDHAQNPRNRGKLADPSFQIGLNNPTCGDEIILYGRVDKEGRVAEATFEGNGCTISMAAASMMTEAVRGKPLTEAKNLLEAYKAMLTGGSSEPDLLGDLESMKGVTQFPMRVKCATLAFNALEKGMEGIEKKGGSHGKA